MKIEINYDSSWRNSFLEGSNNQPLPKQKDGVYRKFVGSMTNLKKNENFINRNVSTDTIMGVLNRLIGDQRKLYQSRIATNYFFKEIESLVSFIDTPLFVNNEITYIRNVTGSTDQKSYTGAIKMSDKAFTSAFSSTFWGVLWLELDELYKFVMDENYLLENEIIYDPLKLINQLEIISKIKPVTDEGEISLVTEGLCKKFGKMKPYDKKGNVIIQSIYCSALYLQLERLSKRHDMELVKGSQGGIIGISHNGFTIKNIMERFTTGAQKIIWGNPYYRKPRFNGDDPLQMTKASGLLEIIIDVENNIALEIKALIENAGVSSFYLGKKGLAYVTDIRI
jgi:hypothetical protein